MINNEPEINTIRHRAANSDNINIQVSRDLLSDTEEDFFFSIVVSADVHDAAWSPGAIFVGAWKRRRWVHNLYCDLNTQFQRYRKSSENNRRVTRYLLSVGRLQQRGFNLNMGNSKFS
jgi:hypothetical protein